MTITNEFIVELEKLEAAATPGALKALGQRVEQSGLSVAYCSESFISGIDGTRSISATEAAKNAKLLAALRNNASALFAALREAWRERDAVKTAHADLVVLRDVAERALCRAQAERDAARAGIHDLCGHKHAPDQACVIGAIGLVERLRKERDEARTALDWQAAATKALSESQERLAQELKEARAEVARLRAGGVQ